MRSEPLSEPSCRAGAAYYPSSPQEAVMVDDVQRWMTTAGLVPFEGVPAR